MKILFFGSDRFSRVALNKLYHEIGKGLIEKVDVICPVAKPVGRGKKTFKKCEVRLFAEQHGLSIFDAPTTNRIKPRIEEWSPSCDFIMQNYDLGVVFSFGFFLPPELIHAFPKQAINIHPSLLPKYRGASPVQRCLMNGDETSGVSIILVDPTKFDSGDLLSQEKVTVGKTETFTDLADRLANLGSESMLQVLNDFENALKNRQVQNRVDKKAFPLARKIKDTDRLIDFHTQDATTIYNYWRGLSENGGIYTYFGDKRVQLTTVSEPGTTNLPADKECGEIHFNKAEKTLEIVCKNQTMISCPMVQPESKKPQPAMAFANGYLTKHKRDFFSNSPPEKLDSEVE